MGISEFELIREYFADVTGSRTDVSLGIGDDCALLQPPAGSLLAVSVDTLVEGRHFSAGAEPVSLGHKALAVNLSDLAAMGAEPAWVMLALTLPAPDAAWLQGFVRGFGALAAGYGVQLVGGDTTRGPLSITVQVTGFIEPGGALTRGGGKAGDRLFVSGCVGDAGLALAQGGGSIHSDHGMARLRERLDRPQPRVALGRLLRGLASAAIDISDGLTADLGHICSASGTGARVDLESLPVSAPVRAECARGHWQYALAGGDDYELLFSVPPGRVGDLLLACRDAGERVQEIGCLAEDSGIVLVYPGGRESEEIPDGFDHFRP